MNIEKIKNYNQKLLAVFGTLAVVFLAGSMLVALFVFIADNWPARQGTQDGLLSDKQTATLQQENKRQQIVSYGMPRLIDTVNLIYVIPAAVQTLSEPEVMKLMDVRESAFSSQREMYYSGARFTNLLLLDGKSNRIDQLFSQRVLIGMYQSKYFSDDILLLFLYADKDTDNDGSINLDDYTNLGIYSLNSRELHQISFESYSVCDYSFIEGSKDLLVLMGVDKDKNGKYQGDTEQSIVMRYDFKTRKLTEVIPQAIQDKLQMLVEGRNNE